MNTPLARFLGVDYGQKRVGLAIADPIGMIATPAGFIPRRAGKRPPIAEIIRRAEALEARGFVIGLPLDGSGGETEWTAEVRRVGDELAKRTSLPVQYQDERYTTATSLRIIREMEGSTRGRKGDVDAMAAAVLLQHALNATE
ncbi:MAG TPA: Holliday junction resolvase RuvX [Gemmatimonadaceae bacterium]|nr:Holliday junction resolvase RuvX [Gemmatimonadaceae bacterium]